MGGSGDDINWAPADITYLRPVKPYAALIPDEKRARIARLHLGCIFSLVKMM